MKFIGIFGWFYWWRFSTNRKREADLKLLFYSLDFIMKLTQTTLFQCFDKSQRQSPIILDDKDPGRIFEKCFPKGLSFQ